jgi:hypothetical protein
MKIIANNTTEALPPLSSFRPNARMQWHFDKGHSSIQRLCEFKEIDNVIN